MARRPVVPCSSAGVFMLIAKSAAHSGGRADMLVEITTWSYWCHQVVAAGGDVDHRGVHILRASFGRSAGQ